MPRLVPSVYSSRELQAAVAAMKAVPREVRSAIQRHTRAEFGPVWKQELRERSATRLQQRVFGGAGNRMTGGNPPVFIAGTSRRPLRGGLVPAAGGAWMAERGSRHARNLLPYRQSGYVTGPAFRALAPRLASLWVQTIHRKVHDAARGE